LGGGNIVAVFELPEVRYIEGAPMEWRRWLTPGTNVALRLDERGIGIIGTGHTAALRWGEVTYLETRGPEEPERRDGADPYKSAARGALLGGWLIGAISGALALRQPKEKWCWLACGLTAGGEIIFEVGGLVRRELQAVLEAHSG